MSSTRSRRREAARVQIRVFVTRAIGLLLTVIFLVLALQRVDLPAFVDELKRVNYVWLIPSAVCTLLGYFVRTVRWRVILSGAAQAPLSTLFPVLIMGFARTTCCRAASANSGARICSVESATCAKRSLWLRLW